MEGLDYGDTDGTSELLFDINSFNSLFIEKTYGDLTLTNKEKDQVNYLVQTNFNFFKIQIKNSEALLNNYSSSEISIESRGRCWPWKKARKIFRCTLLSAATVGICASGAVPACVLFGIATVACWATPCSKF